MALVAVMPTGRFSDDVTQEIRRRLNLITTSHCTLCRLMDAGVRVPCILVFVLLLFEGEGYLCDASRAQDVEQ